MRKPLPAMTVANVRMDGFNLVGEVHIRHARIGEKVYPASCVFTGRDLKYFRLDSASRLSRRWRYAALDYFGDAALALAESLIRARRAQS